MDTALPLLALAVDDTTACTSALLRRMAAESGQSAVVAPDNVAAPGTDLSPKPPGDAPPAAEGASTPAPVKLTVVTPADTREGAGMGRHTTSRSSGKMSPTRALNKLKARLPGALRASSRTCPQSCRRSGGTCVGAMYPTGPAAMDPTWC